MQAAFLLLLLLNLGRVISFPGRNFLLSEESLIDGISRSEELVGVRIEAIRDRPTFANWDWMFWFCDVDYWFNGCLLGEDCREERATHYVFFLKRVGGLKK